MKITFPDNTEVIDSIRDAVGRDVTFFYVYSSSTCPVCSLDPTTSESTDPFCPVCSGLYWIPLISGTTIVAHVTWDYSDRLNWMTGGKLSEGDCVIQIKYTPNNVFIVNNTKNVIVDGKDMQIRDIVYRGVKKVNRILISLMEREG